VTRVSPSDLAPSDLDGEWTFNEFAHDDLAYFRKYIKQLQDNGNIVLGSNVKNYWVRTGVVIVVTGPEMRSKEELQKLISDGWVHENDLSFVDVAFVKGKYYAKVHFQVNPEGDENQLPTAWDFYKENVEERFDTMVENAVPIAKETSLILKLGLATAILYYSTQILKVFKKG